MRSWTVLFCSIAVFSSLAFAQKRQQDNADDERKSFERFFAAPQFAVVREADRVEALPVEIVGDGLSSTHRGPRWSERPVRGDSD